MAKRPFKVVLEEAVNGENTVEATAMSETELELLKEEANKNDIDITEEVTAVEELIEEQNVVNTQIQENEEKLTDSDIIVDASDVEVSEECYKNVCYRLGIKAGTTLKFSNESTFNAVKAEPRKYLALSNEGLKEVVKNIWEKIKAFFKKIWDKITLFLNKLGIKSKLLESKLDKLDVKISNVEKDSKGNIKFTLHDVDKHRGLSTSTESNNTTLSRGSLFEASLYSPLLAMLFSDHMATAKLITPENYISFLRQVSDSAMDILAEFKNYIKNDTQFHTDIIKKHVIASINPSMFPSIKNNSETLSLFANHIAPVDRSYGSSPLSIFDYTATTITYLCENDEKGFEFQTVEIKSDVLYEEIEKLANNTKFDLNTIKVYRKALHKSKFRFKDKFVSEGNRYIKAANDGIEGLKKSLENTTDESLKEKKEAVQKVQSVIKGFLNPSVVGKYAKNCYKNIEATINILDILTSYIEKQ